MALNQTFTLDFISAICTDDGLSPEAIMEILADLESSAVTTPRTVETANLMSTYYSAFVICLLWIDDL